MSEKFNIVNILDFDPEKITYEDSKFKSTFAKYFNIKYEGKTPLIKVPKMTTPFGISDSSKFAKNSDEKLNYFINFSFDNTSPDCSKEMKKVYEKFKQIDEKIKKDCIEKYDKFLKDCDSKKDAKVMIKTQYKSIVKTPKANKDQGKNYSDNLTVKLLYGENSQFYFRLFNSKKENVKINTSNYEDIIKPFSKLSFAVVLGQICISGAGTSVILQMNQAIYYKSKNINENCFLDAEDEEESDDDNSDNEKEENEVKKSEEKETEESSSDVDVSDIDSDSE